MYIEKHSNDKNLCCGCYLFRLKHKTLDGNIKNYSNNIVMAVALKIKCKAEEELLKDMFWFLLLFESRATDVVH